MATPGQLVQVMAESLGIPVETVTNYDRVLSESGMRSKSGRGRGAAKVTASDAANLLIAILGAPVAGASVKEAANTCHTYASLLGLGNIGTHDFARVGLKMLDDLPKKHTLLDGISALINSAAEGEHYRKPRYAKRWEALTDGDCQIRLHGPPGGNLWAGIYASSGQGREYAYITYSALNKKNVKVQPGAREFTEAEAVEELRRQADLSQQRQVTYRTIRKLGSLLSEAESLRSGR